MSVTLPTLRPYQEELVAKLRAALANDRAVIACMPPGGGKTRLAKHIMGAYLGREKRPNESGRAAFMVHRRGLVENASDSFNEDPQLPHGMIMSGVDPAIHYEIQVASIDTKNSWYIEREDYTVDSTYDLIVLDEIHSHVPKFRTFLNAHNRKREELGLAPPFVLGLSATPQHKELNKIFKRIVNGPAPSWLIENGYLSKFRYFQATQGDLSKLVKKGDEYTEQSVFDAMDGLAGDMVRDWQRFGKGRSTIGFFPRRVHAYQAMEILRQNGIDAHYVDGETPDDERRSLFKSLDEGHYDYLANCMVVERGTDIPRVKCIQLCTAFGSVVRYRQCVGRGSRPHPDFSDCIVLDHAANIRNHGFFEDDVSWTLEWGERPSKTHEPRATVECPGCGAVYRGGRCNQCGYEPTSKQLKAQGLAFDGVELKEIKRTDRKAKKTQTNEQLLLGSLYAIGRMRNGKGGTFGQVLSVARSRAAAQGTEFHVPATFKSGRNEYRTIPFGDPNIKRLVKDTYGFVVGDYSRESNPYKI